MWLLARNEHPKRSKMRVVRFANSLLLSLEHTTMSELDCVLSPTAVRRQCGFLVCFFKHMCHRKET